MRPLRLAFLLPLLLSSTPDAAAPADPLAAVAPLLGRWVAEPDPKAPGVTGWTTFSHDLGDRVVVRRNHASYPGREGKPASEHDDLMVLFPEEGSSGRSTSTARGTSSATRSRRPRRTGWCS